MSRRKSGSVREPIQIYMDADDRRMLDALADTTGLSRAEILRRGLRSFAAEQAGSTGPMHSFMQALREKPMPADIGIDHDAYLDSEYRNRHRR